MFEDNEKKDFCSIVTVAKSGQIVICKKFRKLLDIHPGDELLVFVDKKKGLCFAKADDIGKMVRIILENTK